MGRKLHRWGAWIGAIPLFLIITTGILLQLKNWIPGIQPPAVKGNSALPQVNFQNILEASKTVSEANVQQWKDIRAIDVRPSQGVARVRTQSDYEISVDLSSGAVLQADRRRTQILIALHEGTYFGNIGKYGVYLPIAFVLLLLWGTGVSLGFHTLKRRVFN